MRNAVDKLLEAAALSKVHQSTLPYRVDPAGAREAVLLLHGFTGHPGELSIQAEALAEAGFAVMAPRYPGHGSTGQDFMASKGEDWIRRAVDSWLELRAEYGRVHVLGHSMGGAIATLLASALEVPRLVLLAPALDISIPGLALAPVLAPFLPRIKRDRDLPEADHEETRKALFMEYRKDDHVGAAAELFKIMKAARRSLPRVRSRILLVTGERDDSVPAKVVKRVERDAVLAETRDYRRIEGGSHIFPFDTDGPKAARLLVDWMTTA